MKKSFFDLSAWLLIIGALPSSITLAQSILFDFNDAPLHAPLPVSITKGGITAKFTATGEGYSIQDNSAPVFPVGFSGRDIYPSSVFLSDLLIKYDKLLTDFSILYSCQELGCDDAATMRVTAYKNGIYVGTNTKAATHPGTWPVDTLDCSFSSGFDSVVIHYDHRPPTCTDYGVIFLCDDMLVTEQLSTIVRNQLLNFLEISYPNPVSEETSITFTLAHSENIRIALYDMNGSPIKELFAGQLNSGVHSFRLKLKEDGIAEGVYFISCSSEHFSHIGKILVMQ